MRYLIIATALAALAGVAQAQIIVQPGAEGGYVLSGPNGDTVYAPLRSADTKIMRGPDQEGSERDKQWMSYCKPTFSRDEYNVTHYVYAKPGCEFGRDHD